MIASTNDVMFYPAFVSFCLFLCLCVCSRLHVKKNTSRKTADQIFVNWKFYQRRIFGLGKTD